MVRALRQWATALVVMGAGMTVVGALGLLLGWGSTNSGASVAAVRNSASSSSPAASSPLASSSSTTGEDPHVFFDAFQNAVRSGDVAFLADRLHPAVLTRYGSAQCAQAVRDLVDPTVALTLVDVTGPQNFDYASDGRSESVADTFVFDVDGTAVGRAGPRTYHFALVDGRFRTFYDCGVPT